MCPQALGSPMDMAYFVAKMLCLPSMILHPASHLMYDTISLSLASLSLINVTTFFLNHILWQFHLAALSHILS